MADIRTAEKYVRLHERKEQLNDELTKVKAEIAKLEEGLLEYFQRHGLQNLGAGGRKVYIHRQIFASLPNKAEAHRLLREHGFGDLVEDRVVPQRLAAWVREQLTEVEQNEGEIPADSESLSTRLPLPEELKQQIKVTEKFSVRVRKS